MTNTGEALHHGRGVQLRLKRTMRGLELGKTRKLGIRIRAENGRPKSSQLIPERHETPVSTKTSEEPKEKIGQPVKDKPSNSGTGVHK